MRSRHAREQLHWIVAIVLEVQGMQRVAQMLLHELNKHFFVFREAK